MMTGLGLVGIAGLGAVVPQVLATGAIHEQTKKTSPCNEVLTPGGHQETACHFPAALTTPPVTSLVVPVKAQVEGGQCFAPAFASCTEHQTLTPSGQFNFQEHEGPK